MARSSSTSKVAHWAEIIRKYRRSGLTQGRFCREHRVSYHSLRWWLRRLSEEVFANSPPRVRLSVSHSEATPYHGRTRDLARDRRTAGPLTLERDLDFPAAAQRLRTHGG